jgi:tetratricopeptide (TPR) repeat protein
VPVRQIVLWLLFLLAAAGSSCVRDPEKLKLRYVRSGDEYLANKKYTEAILEYRRAVQVAPKYGEARYKLAEAFAAVDDARSALPEYVRAADLLPDRVDLQIKAGNLLLLGGRFQDAKTRARSVLKRDPKNVSGLVLLGNALAGLREMVDAVSVAQRATEMAPGRAGFYTNLGALQLATGNQALAETAFKRAVEIGGGRILPRLALGNFYRASGRINDAEEALRGALTIEPGNVQVNRTLGALLMEASRPAEAEQYFKAAAARSNDLPSQLGLADYYVASHRSAEAVTVLTRLASDPKAFTAAKTRIAIIQVASGSRSDAYKTIAEVLAKSPKDVTVLAFKAQILLADYRVDEALAVIKEAVTIDPRSPQVQLMRGKVHAARDELEEARKAFNEALDLDRFGVGVDAALELAQLHMQRREMDTSIAFADQGVKTHPDSLEARLLLVRTLMIRSEDFPRAENETRALLARYPAQSAANAAWGGICILNRDPAAARKAYERALQLDADCVEAWSGLMVLDAASNNLREFGRRLEARIDHSPRQADLLVLNAKAAALARDAGRAEQSLKRAVAVDPAQPESYSLLGQLYVAQGKLPSATDEFLRMANLDANSVSASTMLGFLYSAQSNVAEAEKWYERAVAISPRGAAAASNNLACMYSERGGNLEAATRLAQFAQSQAPAQPQFNDTLGWIYYKRNMMTQAINALQIAVDVMPDNPVYQFHIGMALAHSGADSRARRSLARALQLAPNLPDADEARRTLKTLVY